MISPWVCAPKAVISLNKKNCVSHEVEGGEILLAVDVFAQVLCYLSQLAETSWEGEGEIEFHKKGNNIYQKQCIQTSFESITIS